MNFYESICFSRVHAAFCGLIPKQQVSEAEYEVAFECLKKMAENRYDWTDEQKEQYKALVDYCKEVSKKK